MSRRSRGVAALGGLAAAGAAAGILFAASPWSNEPEPAATEESAAETPSTTLRVMTFNIFYGGDELDLETDDWCTRPVGCQRTLDQSFRRSMPPKPTSSGSRSRR